MKKILATLFAFLMILSMVNMEIFTVDVRAAEKKSSAKKEDVTIKETVLVDEADVKITAKSLDLSSSYGPRLKLLIENNSDYDLTFQCRDSSVNGYMIGSSLYAKVKAGKKANETLSFTKSDLDLCGIKTIADIEMSFHVYMSDDYDDFLDTPQIQLKTSAFESYKYIFDDSGVVLYDDHDIKIVSKGYDDSSDYRIGAILYIENNSKQNLTVSARDESVNGFMISGSLYSSVLAGKCVVDTITFSKSDLKENGIDKIETIELSFHIYDSEEYDTIVDTETISLDQDILNQTVNKEKDKQPETKQEQKKETKSSEIVLVDESGIKIIAKELDYSGFFGPEVKLLIENNTKEDLTIQCRNSSVNGYMIDAMMSVDVASGKKANDELSFRKTDLEICGIKTIADMEFSFHIFSSDDWDDYLDTDLIQLKTESAEDYKYIFDDAGTLLYNENDIKIVVKGLTNDSLFGPSVLLYIENNREQNITIQTKDESVNGFMVDAICSIDILAGKRAIDTITFMKSDLEENAIDQIDSAEFLFHIYDSDTWDTIIDTELLTITFQDDINQETPSSFTIIAGEAGNYGKLITYNKGTEFEETFYAYYVPVGTYTVTNKGKYMSQINVYSDEIVKNEDGWEEPKDTAVVKLLNVGKTVTITVKKGQHIEIAEPSVFLLNQQ